MCKMLNAQLTEVKSKAQAEEETELQRQIILNKIKNFFVIMESESDRTVALPLSTAKTTVSVTTKRSRTRKKQRSTALFDNKLVYLLFGIGCFSFFITTILFIHLDNQIPNLDNSTSKSKGELIATTTKQTEQQLKGKEIGSGSENESGGKSNDTNAGKDNDSKEKLIKILEEAGVTVSPEIEEQLPTWGEVKSLYGSKPRIIGLETCPNFRSIVPETDAYIGPSGIFNTGTNLLADLLLKYCTLPKRQVTEKELKKFNDANRRMKSGMLWHVPWGKHNPVSWRTHNMAIIGSKGVEQTHVLPVVVIKDPYHWMGSMCRHPYAALWLHTKKRCPKLLLTDKGGNNENIRTNQVTVEYKKNDPGHYESLVGLWNDWYGDYLAIEKFPRLIIRFEDLLFHLEEVMTQICKCGGGTLINNENGMILQEKSAKESQTKGSNGLLRAMLRYGHGELRTDGFTKDEETYAKETLRKDLMDLFGYTHPTKDE